MDNTPSKVVMITTGGTIEKTYDEAEGTLFNRETIIKDQIHSRLRLPYVDLEVKSIMAKDSLDMVMKDRELILKTIKQYADQRIPVVILHGTDTMQMTAELVQKKYIPEVPVVFTGAMKPLGFQDSDAIQNVTESLLAVRLLQPGVYVSFHNRIFSVPGVRKNPTLRTFEAF